MTTEKQAPAVYLAMTGRAREAVKEIWTAEVGVDELDEIIQKLDSLLLKDDRTRVYTTIKVFHHFKNIWKTL